MLLEHAGRTFDSATMNAYATNDPLLPFIYQSTCGRHVLIGRFDIKDKIHLTYASEPEVSWVARKYGLLAVLESYYRGQ